MRKATKTIHLLAALLCAALLVFTASCDNGSDPEDTWTDVSSLDGLEGTWKGAGTVEEEGMTIDYTVTMRYDGSNIIQTTTVAGEDMSDTITKEEFAQAISAGYFKLQVNQDKTKIKYIEYDTDEEGNLAATVFVEVVLEKQ